MHVKVQASPSLALDRREIGGRRPEATQGAGPSETVGVPRLLVHANNVLQKQLHHEIKEHRL